jgi:carbonic anhydrase
MQFHLNARGRVDHTCRVEHRIQATLLKGSSTVISELVKPGSVKVVAGFYDLGIGAVTLVE